MAEGPGGDRTEKGSGRRREEARKQGNVARSQEVSSTAVLLGGGLLVLITLPLLSARLNRLGIYFFDGLDNLTVVSEGDGAGVLRTALGESALGVMPVVAGVLVIGFTASLVQVGWNFNTESMNFRWEKLNAITGLKKFASPNALFELVKNVFKVVLLGSVAWWTLKGLMPNTLDLVTTPVLPGWAIAADMIKTLLLRLMAVLAVLAIADWFWQKHRYEKGIRMTKQEVKQEHKDAEGDPQIKARLRDIQIRKFLKRMMSRVPDADVIITNPTEYAVAIRYLQTEPAPRILAMGKGHLARRIKEIAEEHEIPTVENVPLAQALYKAGEVDGFIPVTLFRAVAEILAAVYRAGKRAKQMLGD